MKDKADLEDPFERVVRALKEIASMASACSIYGPPYPEGGPIRIKQIAEAALAELEVGT